MVTASLTNFRIAPRKMRLVASLIKGKSVAVAADMLAVTTKHSAEPLLKLLNSALANAKNLGISTEALFVKECRVDGGVTMKRNMPAARGSAFPIKKRTSHVRLVLDEKVSKSPSSKVRPIEAPKVEKKPKAKVKAKKE
ncbi:MAG: 50S ribosomal protein L22 [Candidatus Paceibacterota bacterium]|jgi:large subunit ribosomal protein L22